MIAPPWFEIPPPAYGGIESVCGDLIEALILRGHEVVLVGAGRNGTSARFVATYRQPQGHRLGDPLPEIVHAAALPGILDDLDVDVIHDHTLAGPLLARGRETPTVVTAHGPVRGDLARYYRTMSRHVHLVAISNAQRTAAPEIDWAATVHNAVRVADFPFRADKGDHAVFLGRMCPDKGLCQAIDATRAAGVRLVIAGKWSEPAEQEYFRQEVEPRLGQGVEWFGEASWRQKTELLGAARCLLFPIQWEEPFGMVMIEAMACGTPVVALRRGSVPEIVTDGATGFICDEVAQLPAALDKAAALEPGRCRLEARRRFDVTLMAARYEEVYRTACGQRPLRPRTFGAGRARTTTTGTESAVRHPHPEQPASPRGRQESRRPSRS
ncbi:glycosyltransferase family 4 protein [Amycolatopsis acidiphila]|uniref:Glycosyltransferase family 4 protein n=2 Tax=Amycolatopsis acidiphila TaxID=715473 RepID=A0A558ALI1_9PSEU|nr:glycosyltransferase family 4 protein [Amycolatopsis acidiphila]